MIGLVEHTCSRSRTSIGFQRHPAVRLRRECWGGFAFHRERGELLELDQQAFDALATLSHVARLRDLAATARCTAERPVRLPELARFIMELEQRGFVQSVPGNIDSGRNSAVCCHATDRFADWPTIVAPGERDLGAPLVAHWAVTYRCNLACAFCYSQSGPDREREPARDLRMRIVERLADWGVFEVALGGGEPTILSDFSELLATIRRRGMVPNVTTNGVLNSAKILHALAEHAGTVHFSADRSELLDAARGDGVSSRIKETARRLSLLNVRWGVNLLLRNYPDTGIGENGVIVEDCGVVSRSCQWSDSQCVFPRRPESRTPRT